MEQPEVAAAAETTLGELLQYSADRLDIWRTLNREADRLAESPDAGVVQRLREQVGRMESAERFWGFPGPATMAELRRRLDSGDLVEFGVGVRNISRALRSKGYRRRAGDWAGGGRVSGRRGLRRRRL